ncbi:hypothetical protein [Pseudomonas marginalis]|uniref:hypothetical protein n=1 Tax=Pseudomonas marginalis TaxID=298 RepID=UPI000AC6444B|nr:hypothetical protein [Pseudomonas marginalis]
MKIPIFPKNHKQLKSLITYLLLITWLGLFFVGLHGYQGSGHIFVIFSATYLVMLISGLTKNPTYGYTFLTIILWLGFWLKAVFHLLIDYPFVEPIGLFNNTQADWDNVLLVASIGAMGVVLGKYIWHLTFRKKITTTNQIEHFAPRWYGTYRVRLWAGLILFLFIVATLNICYSFQQIGLVPRTVLWPLNTTFFWLLSTGFAMSVSTLLWWEFSSPQKNINTIYFVLLEAGISSISSLSRGLYIFHVIPIAYALLKNKILLRPANAKWYMCISLATLLFFLLCYPLVNTARDFYYSGVPLTDTEWMNKEHSTLINATTELTTATTKLIKFSVDRWIGLEGLMATCAVKEKNIKLFITVATEKGEIGTASIFQEIALSHYRFMDLQKFVFASLPGPISFLYLSGSKWIVGIGMLLLSFILLTLELTITKTFKNPLLSALWGSILATSVAQMGLNISGLTFYLFLCSIGFIVLFLLQYSHALTSIFVKKSKLRQ